MDEKMDSAAKDAEGAKGGRATSSAAIGNVSKVHRERLLAEVAAIKSFLERSGDTNATRLLSFAADLEKEVRGRKFGLIFEEHRERVDVELEENIPVLEEVKERFISHGGTETQSPLNFLIEGDNLAALKLLEKTHRGKIDLIYIDPPYNTGNEDFIYNDSYVDKTDTFRHSKWLSFMRKRLEIAKRLMTDKGVIFISIDDNEQAALKLLCDEVFGEQNFVTNMIWKSTPGSNTGRDIKTVTEYVALYAKDRSNCPFAVKKASDEDGKYVLEDKHKARRGKYVLNKLDRRMTGNHYSESLNYPLSLPNGEIIWPGNAMTKQEHWNWRWSRDKVKWGIENDFIVMKQTKGRWSIYFKQYQFVDNNEQPIERYVPYPNLIEGIDGVNSARGSQEVMEIFGHKVFSYPKPLKLIEHLLMTIEVGNATVLDFFAGSGTTGHAVMKLNAEDGGKRKFILVTNNENDICEKVTYERLKRVMEKEGYDASLKYFKIGFVPIGEEGYWDMADALLGHIRELVELENGIDFDHDNSVAIVLTDEELAEFMKGIPTHGAGGGPAAVPADAGGPPAPRQGVRILYKGHNVILGAKEKEALERRGVRIETIPDYYYPELEG
jgi:adenine-specific DNA-methyltransferase